MRALLRRPSPAMIVACVALLIALGGTSVAAVSQLARNSVGTPQLRNGAVTGPKIANNAVTSVKVRNSSLTRVDFAPGQLPAGPTGPQGPTGPAGPAGPVGPAGAVSPVTVRADSISIAGGVAQDGAYNTARTARSCSGNERAISAGTSWSTSQLGLELVTVSMQPQLNAQGQVTGWAATGGNDSGQTQTFTVHVLCYTP